MAFLRKLKPILKEQKIQPVVDFVVLTRQPKSIHDLLRLWIVKTSATHACLYLTLGLASSTARRTVSCMQHAGNAART